MCIIILGIHGFEHSIIGIQFRMIALELIGIIMAGRALVTDFYIFVDPLHALANHGQIPVLHIILGIDDLAILDNLFKTVIFCTMNACAHRH